MKKISIQFFLIFFVRLFTIAQSAVISPKVALEIAQKSCSDESGTYDYYIGKEYVKINGANYYYFLVDMMPGVGWEHPCRHVYVDTDGQTESHPTIVKDGFRPLADLTLSPILVKNRYGTYSKMKVRVPRASSNKFNENKFSGNTYVVILSGGMNPTANEEHYWNDCSFLYQTLRNCYNIPRKNIKVIMSDGTDPSADMMTTDHEYISSPLDLDGDGIADIEYAATKTNVMKVTKELCASMTDKDHLLFFVVDHGGSEVVDKTRKSYICLWGEERLYPEELNDCLSVGDAGYIDVVMGQCYSGGFVNALRGNNRIIATACAADELSYSCEELPFDEFVYHWTSALNGYDAEGNKVIVQTDTLPSGVQKPVTMLKAYEYARVKDMYSDGKFRYAEETPQVSFLSKSTVEDLALDTIPPTVYLYITQGSVEKPYEPVSMGSGFLKMFKFKWLNRWNSSDVWLRNQDDGMLNQEHENPQLSDRKRDIYVYTKVRNRGVKPYKGEGWSLASWWAESALVITKEVWEGEYVNTKHMLGDKINDDVIEDEINPGDSLIIGYEYVFPKKKINEMVKKGKFVCLLSNVYKYTEPSDFDKTDSEYVLSVWNTDRFAQCNRTYLYPVEAEKIGKVSLFNGFKEEKKFLLTVNVQDEKSNQKIKLRTKMGISSGLMQTWKDDGSVGLNVTASMNGGNYIEFNNDSLSVASLNLAPKQLEDITFKFNPVASSAINKISQRQVDVAVYDSETGQCLGGETYIIKLNPRPAIVPNIEKTQNPDGTYTLAVSNVNEDVSYEWHDKDGQIIGTGCSITVPANSANVDYSVDVVSTSDAAMNTAETTVERLPMIRDVKVGGNSLEMTFNAPVRKNMSVRVLNASSQSALSEYRLEQGVFTCSLPVDSHESGVYQLSLIENGKETENRKVLK